jgi:TetR/AcrR family transcriptional regulator, transcriptional repressor for nem operon
VPRPKEFDRDDVLDRAMDLFWQRGYEATSIGDLVEHVGIGRQSLYDTFGDKHALYVAALDHYRDRHDHVLAGALAADEPIADTLRRIMRAVTETACMLVCAVAERGTDDADVRRRFCGNTAAMEKVLTARLERARAAGEVARTHDPRALARYLISAIYGLQLLARGGADRKHLEQVMDVTLSVLA